MKNKFLSSKKPMQAAIAAALLFGSSLTAQITNTLNFTGSTQNYTVPAGVVTITVDLRGGAGANSLDKLTTNSTGGNGGRVVGVMSVTPGQVLVVNVGGAGNTNGTGGFNGGGSGGNSTAGSACSGGYAAGGGGASDIRVGGVALTDRAIVAGGGGGSGRDYCNGGCQPCGCGGSGGIGGGTTAGAGVAAGNCGYSYGGNGTNGGSPGTASSGGNGGVGDSGGPNGNAGAFGLGGNGAGGSYDVAGGGGGGGYYGGGGGGSASGGNGVGGGGGAGGSSYADPAQVSNVSHSSGFQSGNGIVYISYDEGEALSFDGTNDFVSVSTSTAISSLGLAPFTMEAWVYPTYTTGVQSILRKDGDYNLILMNGTIYTEITLGGGSGGTFRTTQSAQTVPTNQWSHVAAVWNGSTSALFINGVAVSSSTVLSSASALSNLVIGMSPNYGQPFTGKLDEIRIWRRAVCQTEIQNNMTAEIATTASSLVANFHFNYGVPNGANSSFTVANDFSSSALTGTLTNFALTGIVSNWVFPGAVVTGSNVSAFFGPTITINSGAVCAGNAFTLTAGGASTYSYTSGSAVFTPTANTTVSVTGTSSVGCVSAISAVSNITVNINPTITANSGTICNGQSFTIAPSGALTYSYSSGSAVVAPSSNTTINVTGTNSLGCVSTNTAVASINVNPNPVITVNSGSICSGQSFTLAASGALTYTYSNGGPVFTPAASTLINVTGTSSLGCLSSNTAVASVTVNANPTITVNSGSICTGQSFTLVPSGAATYSYSSGSPVVSPLIATAYQISGTSSLGCVSTSSATSNVIVNITPTLTVNSGSICSGKSFTMVPTGASTYTYNSGSAVVTPAANTSYSVTGTSAAGCVAFNTAVSSVTVNTTPTLSINSTNTTICSGTSYTLAASGANTYTWNTAANAASIVVAPTSTTAYNVSGTSAQGCVSNSLVTTINTNSLPVISASGSSICPGASYTFVPSGASSYTFVSSSSTLSGVTASVAPVVSTTYTISGTNANGCISTGTNNAVSNIFIFASPTLVISASQPSVCPGAASTLSVTGANTYTWSNSTVASSINVNPTSATVYSVSGTGTNICNGVKSFTVNVYPTPVITVNSSTVCSGYVFTMVPGGASNYTYSNGSSTVTPITSTNYFVTGTSAQGCTAAVSATAAVTVIASPTITAISGTMCPGLTFSLSPLGADTYTIAGNTSTNVVSPVATETFSVSGTGTNGCISLLPAVATVSVLSNPTVTAASSTSAICVGQASAVLNASGAVTYTWSNATSGNSISVSPSATAVYSVAGSSSLGCIGFATVAINVNPLPPVSITSNTNFVCAGKTASLTASGANTYSWSTGSTSLIVSVNPTTNTTYTLTGIGNLGCVNTATTSVSVSTLVLTVVPAGSVCLGSTYTLTANGAVTYTWNNVQFFQTYPVSPSSASVYTVVATDANNCILSQTVALGIYSLPLVTSTISNSLICLGESATVTADGAASYVWDNGSTNTSIVVSPTVSVSYNYTVTGTDTNSCSASSISTLAVSACTGIDQLTSGSHSFNLYPNPNNGDFTITASEDMTLLVINELGQNVTTIRLDAKNNYKVSITQLPNGIYFVMGAGNSQVIKQKVIVNK